MMEMNGEMSRKIPGQVRNSMANLKTTQTINSGLHSARENNEPQMNRTMTLQ